MDRDESFNSCGNDYSQDSHFQTALIEWDHLEREQKELKEKIRHWRNSPNRDLNFDFVIHDHPQNDSRNRYADVKPLESTRVKLKNVEPDYINGNWISSFDKPSTKRYIATQAPLPSTFGDFWLLVWQEKSSVILMLTDLQEKGLKKADRYWPELGQSMTFGKLTITSVQEREKAGVYFRREFLVSSETGEQRTVYQLQGFFWNDLGVPSNRDMEAILDGLSTVTVGAENNESPLIVHCSAGLGRAGTFILIHTTLEYARETRTPYQQLNFLSVLTSLRKQRWGMVCTWGQYLFAKDFVRYSLGQAESEKKRKREGKENPHRNIKPKRSCPPQQPEL